ncbi:MAG TPA: hypothetical protein VL404_01595 [Candidatus Eisenbacteria bacterium]|nr:hypothetical protein [Candidatus Eisenbacteria bacterium]
MTTPDPETREIQVVRVTAGPNTKLDGISSLEELKVGSPIQVQAEKGQGGSWQATFLGTGGGSSSTGASSGSASMAETQAAQQGDPSLE